MDLMDVQGPGYKHCFFTSLFDVSYQVVYGVIFGRTGAGPALRFCSHSILTCNACRRYSTARIDNLCEDWSGEYYPIKGQDPHRMYIQPFCTTEYHPKPHAHGIYSGPYSLRRRCMGGLGAHRLVHFMFRSLFPLCAEMQMIFVRFLTGGDAFGRQKRGEKG